MAEGFLHRETLVDWPKLVLKMRKYYGPTTMVSRALGRHDKWAEQVSRGEIKDLFFTDGVRLLDLASDHLPPDVLKECRNVRD